MQIVIRPTTKFEKGNQQSYLSIMYILEKYRNISCFKNMILILMVGGLAAFFILNYQHLLF